MKNSSNKQFVFICVALLLAGIASLNIFLQDFQSHDTVAIKDFPTQIGEWNSEDVPISKADLAILETENAFVRRYYGPNEASVYLFIVYSQSNRKVSHPPEICYTGGGITISSKKHDRIPLGFTENLTANQLILKAGAFSQVAYYWFKAGDEFTPSYAKQQIIAAVNSLTGKHKGSALIRVSADTMNQSPSQAQEKIKEFIKMIVPLLKQYLP